MLLKMLYRDVTLLVFVLTRYFTKSYCDLPVLQLFRLANDGVVKPYYWQDYEDVDVYYSNYNYVEYPDIYNDTSELKNYHTLRGQNKNKSKENYLSTNNLSNHTAEEVKFNHTACFHENKRSLCPENKTCARKCCPLGLGYNQTSHKCTLTSHEFNPSVWKGYTLMKGINATKELNFLFGHVTCHSYDVTTPRKGIRLQSDGTLMVERTSAMGPELVFKVNQYCLDLFITENNDIELNAFICYMRNPDSRRHFIVVEICLVISCILILLNVIVYALLPDLRPRHRMIIMAYLTSFLLSFSIKSFEIFLIMLEKTNRHMCLFFTFTFYFFFISGFFWRNIMCYDMWWTIRSKRPMSGQGSETRIRQFLYFLYGFGMPGVITGVVAALEFSDYKNDHPLMPNIRNEGCNALYGHSKAIYQYGPVCILFVINVILFGLTILKIKTIKKETKIVLCSQDSKTHVTKNDKQWMNLYVKLFIVMLIAEVNCTLDFTSRLFPQYEIFRHLADLNVLTVPFIVYLNFKCQGQSWNNIKTRFGLLYLYCKKCTLKRIATDKTNFSSVRTMSTLTQSQEDSQNFDHFQKNPDVENQAIGISISVISTKLNK